MSHQSTIWHHFRQIGNVNGYGQLCVECLYYCQSPKYPRASSVSRCEPFAHVILEKILIHSIQSNDNIISNNTTPIASNATIT